MKVFINPIEIGTRVSAKIGNSIIKGRIDKIMKPGYVFKDSDVNTMRYLVHIDNNQYIVLPHILVKVT